MSWRMLTPFTGRSLNEVYDPFSTLQRELNRVFDDMIGPQSLIPTTLPAAPLRLDVQEDEKAFYVTADLPGLSEQDVDVSFHEGALTIKGEKKVERDEKKDTWHVIERSSGSFSRQIGLPSKIAEDQIVAKFEKGVLTVTLPKMPDEKAKAIKIEVKGN